MKKITALIPSYNEADAITELIAAFPRAQLRKAGYKLDILVIDNNSQDNTAALARKAGARVVAESKQGKGHAVKTGFYNIAEDTDYVVMLDGDNTYRPEEILRLVEPLDSGFAKVIIGSRMHGRIEPGSMKTLNYLGNRAYTRLVRTLYGVFVSDTLTGYFAWTRDVVEELRPHLRSPGFTIEMEMVTKSARLGYEIYSVPVSYVNRLGDSSLHPFRDGALILRECFRNLMWNAARSQQQRRQRLMLGSEMPLMSYYGEGNKHEEA